MSTDLLDLPGYPGHGQARIFAEDCVRNIPENTLDDAGALQAELSRRAAHLSVDQVTALDALSPQTRKLHLRVLLNRISPDDYARKRGGGATCASDSRRVLCVTPQLHPDAVPSPRRQRAHRAA